MSLQPYALGTLPGLLVTLSGVTYTMPPLNALTARRYWDRIQAMQTGTEPDPLGLVSDLVWHCLRRGYPDISADTVAEGVDMDNLEELSAKVFGAGAFRRWLESQPGNAAGAPQQVTAGIGVPSTQPSPPPSAGDLATLTS